jgi:hypothetical protein
MNCPICKDVELKMAQRQNIEIDYCPTCRGVWLDRGELDKIIERSAQEMGYGREDYEDEARRNRNAPRRIEDSRQREDYRYEDEERRKSPIPGFGEKRYDDDDDYKRKKKKGGFLGEVFDIF